MKRLNHILRWDNLDVLGIAFFFSILSFFVIEVLPFLVLFLFYARKHLSWILYFLGCLIFMFQWVLHIEEPTSINMHDIGMIIDKDTFDYNDRYIIRIKQQTYHMYAPKDTFELGDQVLITGQFQRYENATVPYGFDAYMYYRSKQILGKIQMEHYQIMDHKITFYQWRDKIITVLMDKQVSPYVLNTFFGQALDQQTRSIYDQLGITYLLSISGLHLFVLVEILRKILFYFSVSDKRQSLIVFAFYGCLSYAHRMDLGIMRLCIMHSLLMLNDHFSWRKSRFELLQLTFMIILFTQIYQVYSSGILISYLIITIIYLIKPIMDRYSGYTKRFLYSAFLSIWLIPFFQRLDLLLLLWMPICIVLIAYGLTLGSLIVLLIPPLTPLLERYSAWIEQGLIMLGQSTYPMVLPKMTMPWILIFYAVVILFFLAKTKVKKAWIVLCCFLLVLTFKYVEKNESRLLFLDVGQGDSTILETKDCVAVIDSFANTHDYLKHRGITQIDYLFLTHSDIDHIKEVDLILRDFHINKIIGSFGVETYPFELKGIEEAKGGDQYTCGEIQFHILAPIKTYEDENNASLVIQFDYQEHRILLAGDIEHEAELDLISHYGSALKSDILKIAHHGSNTSSSTLFLYYVNPHIAIISAGRNNRYQFPSEDVLDRLIRYDVMIYRTDQLGTIVFDPNRKGGKWYFYLPFSPRFWYNMYRARGRMYG